VREERRLPAFENRKLRRIFGPKRDEVTGEWRRLHNKELYGLYFSRNILVVKSRRMRWAGLVARVGETRGACRVLVGNLREGDHLEDPDVNGRIILKWIFERLGGGIDWIDLAQDRDRWRAVVNAVMNLRAPQNAGNFLSS
jgi:hypothetical protein